MREPLGESRVDVVYPSQGAATARLSGEPDFRDREEVERLLFGLIDRHQIVVADLSAATYVDSSILQCLLGAERHATEHGRAFRLHAGTSTPMERLLEITGLTLLFRTDP